MNDKFEFIKPDFEHNIVNISATVAEFLGCPNDKPILPILHEELRKNYKNIIFLTLDGFGIYPMEVGLSDNSFLKKNVKQILTSVFPSTTTNATTTLLTNKYPMEHGWFGWSLYFEELKRSVDIFPEIESISGEPIEAGYVRKKLPISPFYRGAKIDHEINLIVPEFWHGDDSDRRNFKTLDEMLAFIGEACRRDGKQFIYAYYPEPDSGMHRYGVTSPEARTVMREIDRGLENLTSELTDTLFIVTADHGQIDVEETVELYKYDELTSLLAWELYLEARATAFKVKDGCREKFVALFHKKYGEDFELVAAKDLIEKNFFGPTTDRAALLGDYIAIGKTHKIMKLHARGHDFKGHHTSLRSEEMLVPLILFGSK